MGTYLVGCRFSLVMIEAFDTADEEFDEFDLL